MIAVENYDCYVLVAISKRELRVKTRRRQFNVPSGTLLYVGSGMRGRALSRVLRHLAVSGRPFWHIDYLLSSSEVRPIGAILVKHGGEECEAHLAQLLRRLYEPVEGFGCSDRPEDRAHLFVCRDEWVECAKRVFEEVGRHGWTHAWIQHI